MAINFVDGKYVHEDGHVTLDPTVYKDWQIAEEAEKALPSVDYFREKLGLLPEELRESYRPLLHESDPGVARIVKAADKLSAYIKCGEELKAGNREFEAAARQTREALTEMHLPCLDYFMAHFLDAFQLTLDELD